MFGTVRLAMVVGGQGVIITASVRAQDRPNILVIWDDDISMRNVGAYSSCMMRHTPNNDRIASL